VIRSAPSRPADVALAQRMIYHNLTTIMRDRAWPCRAPCASRSLTSPSPSVIVMIRPAADETITRDGRPLGQAGTSYVANGLTKVCEVKSLQWQHLQGLQDATA
jgi:hypothetical protein